MGSLDTTLSTRTTPADVDMLDAATMLSSAARDQLNARVGDDRAVIAPLSASPDARTGGSADGNGGRYVPGSLI